MAKLYFIGRDFPVEFEVGGNILDAVIEAKQPIATACGGMGACGQCHCHVVEGADHLSPSNERELKLLGQARLDQGERLACQSTLVVDADIRVRLPKLDDIIKRRQDKWTRQLKQRRAQQKAEREQRQKNRR